MGKVAIVTDSNSGITQSEAKELGVYVIPMPFYINEELFFEDITLTQEEFYKKLEEDANISTSMPSPGDVMDLWDRLLEEYDEVVHIPMSSGLSSFCHTSMSLAQDYEGKVYVVDNQRISVTQRRSVEVALKMAEKGVCAQGIVSALMDDKMESSIYITVDTLKYLKKGGRITPAAAALGTVLNLKPVLQIQGEKLDAFAKVRGIKAAKKKMLEAIDKDLSSRFSGQKVNIDIAYTCSEEDAAVWVDEVKAKFPEYVEDMHVDKLSLSVSCHIGAGSVAITCTKVTEA